MKKMTFEQVYEMFVKHNEKNGVESQFSDSSSNRLFGVVVFKSDNWPGTDYSLESRSYKFASDNKYFVPGLGGNSIYADCLDRSEAGIRLDFYLSSWVMDYCYIEGE